MRKLIALVIVTAFVMFGSTATAMEDVSPIQVDGGGFVLDIEDFVSVMNPQSETQSTDQKESVYETWQKRRAERGVGDVFYEVTANVTVKNEQPMCVRGYADDISCHIQFVDGGDVCEVVATWEVNTNAIVDVSGYQLQLGTKPVFDSNEIWVNEQPSCWTCGITQPSQNLDPPCEADDEWNLYWMKPLSGINPLSGYEDEDICLFAEIEWYNITGNTQVQLITEMCYGLETKVIVTVSSTYVGDVWDGYLLDARW